jgi:hypothetical protein
VSAFDNALRLPRPHPAPPLAGIWSVFPPVQTERAGQGTQAGELADILHKAALSGRLDFPGRSCLVRSLGVVTT